MAKGSNHSEKKLKRFKKNGRRFLGEKISAQTKRRTVKSKLKRGLRTPEEKFMKPILESIIELGGSAFMKNVLKLVRNKMKNILNEYDYKPLPSDTKQKRWENTAQWARNSMVNDGLLSSNSPRGIWEITKKGRDYYHQNKNTT